MSRLMSVLLWSVLAAAFIGPGTVTTCALAGHEYGVSLGWALAFSVLACVVLQEAAARLAIVTGDDVGLALRRRFSGGVGVAIGAVVVGAVIVGCAAYEAGNILGAIAGIRLVVDVPVGGLAVSCAVVAAVLLWPGKTGLIATAMGALVTIMGVAFAVIAVDVGGVGDVARGLVVPSLPDGSALVVLGLVGTTVVPYNLFLARGWRGASTTTSTARSRRAALASSSLLSSAARSLSPSSSPAPPPTTAPSRSSRCNRWSCRRWDSARRCSCPWASSAPGSAQR